MPKIILNKISLILVRVVGMVGFVWQIVQFFYSKWTYEWYVEVFMLTLFFVISRYPSKILNIFGAFTTILNKKTKN